MVMNIIMLAITELVVFVLATIGPKEARVMGHHRHPSLRKVNRRGSEAQVLLPRCLVAFTFVVMGSAPALAATYPKIPPYANINDIRAVFPGASLEFTQVGWLKPSERLLQVTNLGISGHLMVKLFDIRPVCEKLYQDAEVGSKDEALFEVARRYPDDKGFVVAWVRLVPDRPLPISLVFERYGKSHFKGFTDDLQRYVEWTKGPNEGLQAYFTTDGKSVLFLSFLPSSSERSKYDFLLERRFAPVPIPTPEPSEEPEEPESATDSDT